MAKIAFVELVLKTKLYIFNSASTQARDAYLRGYAIHVQRIQIHTQIHTQKNSNNEMARGYMSLLDADPEGQRFMTLVFTITFGFKSHHNTQKSTTTQRRVHACCTASREALCVLISAHQNDKCTRRIELHIMQPHLDRLKKTEYEVMDLPVSTQRYLNTLFMLYDWIILYFSLLNEVQLAETGVF